MVSLLDYLYFTYVCTSFNSFNSSHFSNSLIMYFFSQVTKPRILSDLNNKCVHLLTKEKKNKMEEQQQSNSTTTAAGCTTEVKFQF